MCASELSAEWVLVRVEVSVFVDPRRCDAEIASAASQKWVCTNIRRGLDTVWVAAPGPIDWVVVVASVIVRVLAGRAVPSEVVGIVV